MTPRKIHLSETNYSPFRKLRLIGRKIVGAFLIAFPIFFFSWWYLNRESVSDSDLFRCSDGIVVHFGKTNFDTPEKGKILQTLTVKEVMTLAGTRTVGVTGFDFFAPAVGGGFSFGGSSSANTISIHRGAQDEMVELTVKRHIFGNRKDGSMNLSESGSMIEWDFGDIVRIGLKDGIRALTTVKPKAEQHDAAPNP